MNASVDRVPAMSSVDFAALGLNQVAYIRPLRAEFGVVYAVAGADGSPLGIAPDIDSAILAVRRQDLDAVLAH